jgi:hypothetical protein
MPHPSSLLTAFARRDAIDKVMFGWVRCMTRTLPGVSVERALEEFRKEYAIPKEQFNAASQATRYQRMVREFWDDQKTEKE